VVAGIDEGSFEPFTRGADSRDDASGGSTVDHNVELLRS
jgi:hypothetical protein